jgi:hypothetical protein
MLKLRFVYGQRAGPNQVGRGYANIRMCVARRSVLPASACDEDRSAGYPSGRLKWVD